MSFLGIYYKFLNEVFLLEKILSFMQKEKLLDGQNPFSHCVSSEWNQSDIYYVIQVS